MGSTRRTHTRSPHARKLRAWLKVSVETSEAAFAAAAMSFRRTPLGRRRMASSWFSGEDAGAHEFDVRTTRLRRAGVILFLRRVAAKGSERARPTYEALAKRCSPASMEVPRWPLAHYFAIGPFHSDLHPSARRTTGTRVAYMSVRCSVSSPRSRGASKARH